MYYECDMHIYVKTVNVCIMHITLLHTVAAAELFCCFFLRNLTLKNLFSIKASQASIRISKNLFTEASNEAQFECLSGNLHEGRVLSNAS